LVLEYEQLSLKNTPIQIIIPATNAITAVSGGMMYLDFSNELKFTRNK
jgi:hypothetical protein